MAERIQLRRTKGWRKPEGAVVVARPTRWGNPWKAQRSGTKWIAAPARDAVFASREKAVDWAVDRFRFHALRVVALGWNSLGFNADELAGLRGKDLACWCPLDQPCHADVLLELANA